MADTGPAPQARGIIGQTHEAGRRVIWNFVNELPGDAARAGLPCLIVLRWVYDGSANDGMPDDATQAAIYRMDRSLWPLEDGPDVHRAYTRTGNELREWAFYAATTAGFMAALNRALAGRERYPLDIRFYDDPDWADFRSLLHDFGQTSLDATH